MCSGGGLCSSSGGGSQQHGIVLVLVRMDQATQSIEYAVRILSLDIGGDMGLGLDGARRGVADVES